MAAATFAGTPAVADPPLSLGPAMVTSVPIGGSSIMGTPSDISTISCTGRRALLTVSMSEVSRCLLHAPNFAMTSSISS